MYGIKYVYGTEHLQYTSQAFCLTLQKINNNVNINNNIVHDCYFRLLPGNLLHYTETQASYIISVYTRHVQVHIPTFWYDNINVKLV